MCGTCPRASPTPRLVEGSRNSTGLSWAWMSVRWTRVTLPTGSNLRSSSCVSFCCAKARVQPAGVSAAVAAATWRNSRLEIILPQRGVASGLADRDRLFARDGRSVIVGPGQHHRPGFLRLELELDVRIGRHRGLEVCREHLLAGDGADK